MVATRRVLLGLVVLTVAVSVLASAQPSTYEEFLKEFMTEKANMIQRDADQFDKVLDQWRDGEISQSTVVTRLKEMESRAEGYFEEVLRLPAPVDKFERYKQSIYSFVTWYNIIGLFADGMTDLNMAKLDAAGVLSEYFGAKTDQFEEELVPTD
jgi:hypothetical protein